jgi:hypothetical protein
MASMVQVIMTRRLNWNAPMISERYYTTWVTSTTSLKMLTAMMSTKRVRRMKSDEE